MWQVAIEIASRCGGDRGSPGLFGPSTAPAAVKPERLIVLETQGWPELDGPSRTAFETLLENLKRAGVTILRRADHPWIEALERSLGDASKVGGMITAWENRWFIRNLVNQNPNGVSARAQATLKSAEAMTPEDYRVLLMERAAAQQRHAAIGPLADALILPSCPGPAPLWPGDSPGQPLAPRPTGNSVFNMPSSMLFAPCVTMPLMSVGAMPMGAQLMGQQHQDARMTAYARWMLASIAPVIA
jgi:Asp-tRNA(Asn)/Glu-tRNA(Gln) amidotransferase A subunit family amidase